MFKELILKSLRRTWKKKSPYDRMRENIKNLSTEELKDRVELIKSYMKEIGGKV